MARYIDEEILINEINNRVTNSLIRGWLASIIDETPTADVVEVVRCKDCKYFLLGKVACTYPNHNGWCTVGDYCSFGERNDNNG